MSQFTNLEDWKIKSEVGNYYVTTKQVSWEIGKKGSGLWLRVSKGYKFDVSIPKVLQWLLSPHDERFLKAAALHDWALHVENWDRVSSAAAFSEALRAKNVGTLTRLTMVLSVIIWKWK